MEEQHGADAPEESEPGLERKGYFNRTFRALHYRDFRLLWFGAFTSTTGTWMQQVAQSWIIFELTNRAFYLGLIDFLAQLPIILFGLLGGALADRLDRRRLLLFSQLVQMSVAFVLAMLVFLEHIEVWHFLLLAFMTGTGQSFGGPAYQAMLPSLVHREDVPNAIALNSIQFNMARIFGPVLAGAALASLGAVVCFFLNGVSFLAVVVALLMIRSSFSPARARESITRQIGRGFQFVKHQGDLWHLTILGFVSTFCGVSLMTLLPVFARQNFGLDATGFAWLTAVSGAGATAGGLLYASYSRIERKGLFALWVQLSFSVLLALFALAAAHAALIVAAALLFLGGMCLINLFASIASLVQLATTDEMRGRVMSIFMLAFRGGMPLGGLLSGALADRFSPQVALWVLSLLLATVAGGFLLSRSGVKQL